MGRMENNKLTYHKNNPEGKISVKYYLNTDLKPKISDSGVLRYPLYFKVTVKKQATKVRSLTEHSFITIEDFSKIEKTINYHTVNDFNGNLKPLLSSGYFEEHFSMIVSILSEKDLLFEIVKDCNPFNKANFDIKEVVYDFEIYNQRLSISLNKVLGDTIKSILELEAKKDNLIAVLYLRSIDWGKANAYDLLYIMKDNFQALLLLINQFKRCFQIVAGTNINYLTEEEERILIAIGDKNLKDIKMEMKNHDYYFSNPIFDPIIQEIETLFFGK